MKSGVKITGLEKLQKEFAQAQRAFQKLDGQLGSLALDATEPAAVQAAINKMEAMVDSELEPYRANKFVINIADSLKEKIPRDVNRICSKASTFDPGEKIDQRRRAGISSAD